jgi:hypothetical protein
LNPSTVTVFFSVGFLDNKISVFVKSVLLTKLAYLKLKSQTLKKSSKKRFQENDKK